MKRFALITIALLALSGAAIAGPADLHSSSRITLETVAPEVDATNLTPIQISRINDAVASDDGLSRGDVLTIVQR